MKQKVVKLYQQALATGLSKSRIHDLCGVGNDTLNKIMRTPENVRDTTYGKLIKGLTRIVNGEIDSNTNGGVITSSNNNRLQSLSDKALADELRRRGYELRIFKQVVL